MSAIEWCDHTTKTATGWRAPRVFIGSMTDHFHEKVTIGMFRQVLDFIRQRPRTIWQMTKRPENAFKLLRIAFEQRVHAAPWPRIHQLHPLHPKGGKMAEWPADLQVQEFPR